MHHYSFTQISLVHKSLEYVSVQEPCGVSLLVETDQEILLLAKIQTIPFIWVVLW